MGINRYNDTQVIDRKSLGTWDGIDAVQFISDVENGVIKSKTHIFKRGERLEQIAYKYYKDPTYWWIVAFVNRIGFALQVKPGTKLYIPPLEISLNRILSSEV